VQGRAECGEIHKTTWGLVKGEERDQLADRPSPPSPGVGAVPERGGGKWESQGFLGEGGRYRLIAAQGDKHEFGAFW